MNEGQRIKGDKVTISDKEVLEFFENRTKKKLYHRFNLVNYQDNNPRLALDRDYKEKEKIFPLLNVSENSRILDIGCGVGRWGDKLTQYLKSGKYYGVDYSKNLIEVAQSSAKEDGSISKRSYCVGAFQNLSDVLIENNIDVGFDLIIINGVLMYINDLDIEKCLKVIPNITKKNGLIYIKESIGTNDRFTIRGVFSEELGSEYSAIYRSQKEYEEIFYNLWGLQDSSLIGKGETFDDDLNNRKETTSFYWIIKNDAK